MCLLIFKPANVSIPVRHLENGDQSNPHGCGIAWADGENIHHAKGAKWSVNNIVDKLAKLHDFPAIIHFRLATHGGQNDENTHPFELPDKWAAAHNGIISGLEMEPDESDTRAFLRRYVAPYIQGGGCLTDPHVVEVVSNLMGSYNKMAFLHSSGKYCLANEDSGHWIPNGGWYSNYGYKDYEYYGYHGVSKSYGKAWSGWTAEEEAEWEKFDYESSKCEKV